MLAQLDPISPGLSAPQKERLLELERTIERSLSSFLECGRALLAVRDEKLYLEHYRSFEDYCVRRWGISSARGRTLIRSTLVAETLLRDAEDAPLSADLAENVMRPLSKLRPELATQCWRLACKVTEKPTHFVVSKITRVVMSAIAEGSGNSAHKSKRTESEVTTFLRPIFLLSRTKFPSADLLICHFADKQQAKRCQVACQELISRCETLIAELQRKFPELTIS